MLHYSSFTFIKAYCLYRLNRTEEALQLINEEPNNENGFKELKAQILYKLERLIYLKRYLDSVLNK